MSGILRLESLTKGNTLKQGDKTPLKYRLFDADGDKLNIAGKSAKVRLVYPDFLTIGYEKDGLTVAQDDTVTFTIDGVIPSRIYHVEIIVDDQFIFPSRADESKFTVDKSSLGTEANIIEIVGVDAVVRKAVDLINDDPSLIIDEDKLVTDIISNTGIGSIEEYYKAFNDLKPKAEQSITKSAEALTKSQNALNVANGIDAKATNALSLSESADTLSKSVQEQFNQVVIDGDSSVEAAQARVDASGQTNPSLKARLDKEHNEVTTQLAQKANSDMVRENTNIRPINVTEMDTETRQLFTGGAVAVVGEDVVGTENLKALSISSQNIKNKQINAEKTDFMKRSTNLINLRKLTLSKNIHRTTGELIDNSFLDVIENEPVNPNFTYTGIGIGRVSFKSHQGTVISIDNLNANASSTFTTPSGCYYIDYTIIKTRTNTAQLNEGNILMPYEPYSNSLIFDAERVNYLNRIQNSDFSNGVSGWNPTSTVLSTMGDQMIMSADGSSRITSVRTFTTLLFESDVDEVLYLSLEDLEVNSDAVQVMQIRMNGSVSGTTYTANQVLAPNKDQKYKFSGLARKTDHVGQVAFDVAVNFNETSDANGAVVKFRKPYMVSLTRLFGAGNEPDLESFEEMLEQTGGLSVSKVTSLGLQNKNSINLLNTEMEAVSTEIEDLKSFGIGKAYTLQFETVEPPVTINTLNSNRLTLIGVKTDNSYNAKTPPVYAPNAIGYLYLDSKLNKLYYSANKYDNPVHLFDWDKALAGNTNCIDWIPIITNDGDVIFLPATSLERSKPIIYPANNYGNPQVINLTQEYLPHGLTTSTGFAVSPYGDFFMFGEYMPIGQPERNGEPLGIWKVTKPYSNPENWRVVDTWYRSHTNDAWLQNPTREITHFHTVVYDHYSGFWYANTGDSDPNCRVIESQDDGETWTQVISGAQKWRTLGYVFTEDACYWGTDSDYVEHKLYKAPRNTAGRIDFSQTVSLAQLSLKGQRTYNTCLIREPHGLLMLDRAEPRHDGVLDVEFWDFEDNKLYNLGEYVNYYAIPENHPRFGFGNIAVTYYQPTQEDGIISGGGGATRHMSIGVLNNKMGNNNTLGVIKIKVVRKI